MFTCESQNPDIYCTVWTNKYLCMQILIQQMIMYDLYNQLAYSGTIIQI